MSNAKLIEWFHALLFGSQSALLPPPSLREILLRMEAENLDWNHIMLRGGLTAFSYHIHGDLNSLIDHLEKQWLDREPSAKTTFRTRTVARFWDHLEMLLAKRDEVQDAPLPSHPPEEIKDLKSFDGFWDRVADRFGRLRKPLSPPTPLPPLDCARMRRAVRLYEITCQSRGRYWDPLSMYCVPQSEYVNAVHWQSADLLESFMLDRPAHPLTQSIRCLMDTLLNNILNGERPALLSTPSLDAFLHNLNRVHASVREVPARSTPPKLIDVFQRLLALSRSDWEINIPDAPPCPKSAGGLEWLLLTEQLRISERQIRILRNGLESCQERDERICD